MVIFLSGVYGVGKSTIGKKISEWTGLSLYSASSLITSRNGEKYSKTKHVTNKSENQRNLIEAVSEILSKEKRIILDGHFCIVNRQLEVVELPRFVYKELSIERIITLTANTDDIIINLKSRDNSDYSSVLIREMKLREEEISKQVALELEVPRLKYKVDYPYPNLEEVFKFIN